jgi:plastocyanin
VRRSRQAIAASAFACALFVPALPLAAQELAADPEARLEASVTGKRVAFDASRSADADGRVVAYAWDLDGDGVFETDGADKPTVERSYPFGTALVASVRVTDDTGATDEATATVAVDEPAAPEPLPDPKPVPEAKVRAASTPEPTVVAAASKSVTIKDFSFGPSTISIGVGDTVTWTNQGPSIHTATANDGSFDSGNLADGKSFSKTFSSAGTISYICTPHPFMTGKIVVASGSGGGSAGGGSSGGDSASGAGSGSDTSSGSGTATDDPALARTGADLIPWSLFGLSMLVFGAALRWRLTVD